MRSRRSYEQLLRDVVTEYNRCLGRETEQPVISNEIGEAKVAVRLRMREKPDTRSAVKGVLDPYTVIQFTSIIENGESINNNPVWYRLSNGSYVWSGGLLKTEPEPVAP